MDTSTAGKLSYEAHKKRYGEDGARNRMREMVQKRWAKAGKKYLPPAPHARCERCIRSGKVWKVRKGVCVYIKNKKSSKKKIGKHEFKGKGRVSK